MPSWEVRRRYMRALQDLKDAANRDIDRTQEGAPIDDELIDAVGEVLLARRTYCEHL